MHEPNQIEPDLRPQPAFRGQARIHNPVRDGAHVLEGEAVAVHACVGDGLDRDGAVVEVGPGAVDPGVRELHLVEERGGGGVRPFVEVRVCFGFGEDGADEFHAAA